MHLRLRGLCQFRSLSPRFCVSLNTNTMIILLSWLACLFMIIRAQLSFHFYISDRNYMLADFMPWACLRFVSLATVIYPIHLFLMLFTPVISKCRLDARLFSPLSLAAPRAAWYWLSRLFLKLEASAIGRDIRWDAFFWCRVTSFRLPARQLTFPLGFLSRQPVASPPHEYARLFVTRWWSISCHLFETFSLKEFGRWISHFFLLEIMPYIYIYFAEHFSAHSYSNTSFRRARWHITPNASYYCAKMPLMGAAWYMAEVLWLQFLSSFFDCLFDMMMIIWEQCFTERALIRAGWLYSFIT